MYYTNSPDDEDTSEGRWYNGDPNDEVPWQEKTESERRVGGRERATAASVRAIADISDPENILR